MIILSRRLRELFVRDLKLEKAATAFGEPIDRSGCVSVM